MKLAMKLNFVSKYSIFSLKCVQMRTILQECILISGTHVQAQKASKMRIKYAESVSLGKYKERKKERKKENNLIGKVNLSEWTVGCQESAALIHELNGNFIFSFFLIFYLKRKIPPLPSLLPNPHLSLVPFFKQNS